MIKNRFNLWLMRDLFMNGRIILSKTEGLSRLLYPAVSLEVPNNLIIKITKKIFSILFGETDLITLKNVP